MLEIFFIIIGLASIAQTKKENLKLKWWVWLACVVIGLAIASLSLYNQQAQIANYIV
jgi:multisubunit Na+/H+ antiporter MnhB subunit